jgi:hypothetical protein
MWAEANPAGGATFRFTLPAASSEQMAPRGKVYVVDDDEAMRDSLDFLFGAADFDVTLFERPSTSSMRSPALTLDAWSPTFACPASTALNS